MGTEKSFLDVIDQYNLSVHFFIGTTFFESLYLNKPTILIFNKEHHFELDERFTKFISKLIDKKICFKDLDEAVAFLNKNYLNLEIWWNNSKTQKIIDEFCNFYCKRSTDIRKDLRKITKI